MKMYKFIPINFLNIDLSKIDTPYRDMVNLRRNSTAIFSRNQKVAVVSIGLL